MNIFEALRESHDRQRTYAKSLIKTSGDTPQRVEAYKQLKAELQAHETAEERHFGSSRNPGKHRNKNADLVDDVRASKHI